VIIGSIAAAFVANDVGDPVLSIRAEFVSTIGVEFVGIVTAIGRGPSSPRWTLPDEAPCMTCKFSSYAL